MGFADNGMSTVLPKTLPNTIRIACQWLNPTCSKASEVSLKKRYIMISGVAATKRNKMA